MRVTPAWLASFRLRILFRSAFLFLALAVVTMAITALQEEKQRSHDHYQESFTKTKEQIVARLYHPSGQLALHFGLGMWIRNNRGLWSGNDQLMQAVRKQDQSIHPDDASMVIVEAVRERLREMVPKVH